MKNKITSKRSVFQGPNFIRFLCKIVGVPGFHALHYLLMHQNHPRVFFILNPLNCFQLKPCVKCFSNLLKMF